MCSFLFLDYRETFIFQSAYHIQYNKCRKYFYCANIAAQFLDKKYMFAILFSICNLIDTNLYLDLISNDVNLNCS